jgi:hypothetical protein
MARGRRQYPAPRILGADVARAQNSLPQCIASAATTVDVVIDVADVGRVRFTFVRLVHKRHRLRRSFGRLTEHTNLRDEWFQSALVERPWSKPPALDEMAGQTRRSRRAASPSTAIVRCKNDSLRGSWDRRSVDNVLAQGAGCHRGEDDDKVKVAPELYSTITRLLPVHRDELELAAHAEARFDDLEVPPGDAVYIATLMDEFEGTRGASSTGQDPSPSCLPQKDVDGAAPHDLRPADEGGPHRALSQRQDEAIGSRSRRQRARRE